MTVSQRGSVLLTVIAGLVLLALLGSAMLTLMTPIPLMQLSEGFSFK